MEIVFRKFNKDYDVVLIFHPENFYTVNIAHKEKIEPTNKVYANLQDAITDFIGR